MYNGNIGGVGGGDNIKWNRQLADELDAADGKKDGKINQSIWNSFLSKIGSKGNHINNFITVDNAAKSFAYYNSTKDVGTVDWGDWKGMLNTFLGKTETVPSTDPASAAAPAASAEAAQGSNPTTPSTPANNNQAVTEQQKSDFEALKQSGVLDQVPNTPAQLKEAGFGIKPQSAKNNLGLELYQQDENGLYYIQDMNGGRTYVNEKGESIRISTFEGKLAGGEVEVTYTSADGKVQNHVTYDANDKPISGFVSVKNGENALDATYYRYTFDVDGNKVLSKVDEPSETASAPVNTPVNNTEVESEIIQSKFDLEAFLKNEQYELVSDKNGVKTYRSKIWNQEVQVTKDKNGQTTLTNIDSDTKKQIGKSLIDKDGYLVQRTEFKEGVETGNQITIQRNYFRDGSIEKVAYVDGEKMDNYDDGSMLEIGELQFMVKNSPSKPLISKFPTEADLLKAGYKKNEAVMTGNGGVLYENSETGESVVLTESMHSVEYRKGNIKQVQSYDDKGNVIGGRITESNGNGIFKVYKYSKNEENGRLAVTSSFRQNTALEENFEFAADGIEGHKENIIELMQKAGLPSEVPIDPIKGIHHDKKTNKLTLDAENMTTDKNGNINAWTLSKDGKYKTTMKIDKDGNVTITYAQKQANGKFKDITEVKLLKQEASGSLRGYDYSFEAVNYKTGYKTIKSAASWEEGNY